jgi:hypothetical protein
MVFFLSTLLGDVNQSLKEAVTDKAKYVGILHNLNSALLEELLE